MKLSPFAITQLEQALNGLIALDPETGDRVNAVDGQIVSLNLSRPGFEIFLASRGGRLCVLPEPDRDPAATLTGSLTAFTCAGLTGISGKPWPDGQIEIEGNQETGQAFLTILDKLSIDWEEQLSKLTGDVMAHQAGNIARKAAKGAGNLQSTLRSNLSEYLQEELRVLPTRIEVENFMTDIADLEKRVQAMEKRIHQPGKTS
jgi:ubiquinone biosynthesis protein UbiJ